MIEKRKKMLKNLMIIFGPVLLIMAALTLGYVDIATLGRWDIAISIGAIMTVFIYLLLDKR